MRTQPPEKPSEGTIEAYLDAVEQALVRGRASIAERQQIREDLESQIADMMTRASNSNDATSEEAVLAKLEGPNRFAESYFYEMRSGSAEASSQPARHAPWVVVSASIMAAIVVKSIMLSALPFMHGPLSGIIGAVFGVSVLLCILFMPIALRKGLRQLRAQPETYSGSRLLLNVTLGYAVVVPVALLVLICVITKGYILFPIAIIAIAYVVYRWVSRLKRKLLRLLPEETAQRNSQDSSSHFNSVVPSVDAATISPWAWLKTLAFS